MTTITNDPLHASIAAGLVEANLNSQSVVHVAEGTAHRCQPSALRPPWARTNRRPQDSSPAAAPYFGSCHAFA